MRGHRNWSHWRSHGLRDQNLPMVLLTGQAPIWLYLKIAHALHGKARRLIYRSPVTGDVVIFDHDPF